MSESGESPKISRRKLLAGLATGAALVAAGGAAVLLAPPEPEPSPEKKYLAEARKLAVDILNGRLKEPRQIFYPNLKAENASVGYTWGGAIAEKAKSLNLSPNQLFEKYVSLDDPSPVVHLKVTDVKGNTSYKWDLQVFNDKTYMMVREFSNPGGLYTTYFDPNTEKPIGFVHARGTAPWDKGAKADPYTRTKGEGTHPAVAPTTIPQEVKDRMQILAQRLREPSTIIPSGR